MLEQELRATIVDVPDFPRKGILFKDITPILRKPALFKAVENRFVELAKLHAIDAVVGVESRGFFWGPGLAVRLGVPFIPARKKGKLPGKVRSISYQLEYGDSVIEISEGAIQKGWKVLVHDDLLATGGTAQAIEELISGMGANVEVYLFLITLNFLNGKTPLEKNGAAVEGILQYN
jgi:adenine phosphoribosyltransferase